MNRSMLNAKAMAKPSQGRRRARRRQQALQRREALAEQATRAESLFRDLVGQYGDDAGAILGGLSDGQSAAAVAEALQIPVAVVCSFQQQLALLPAGMAEALRKLPLMTQVSRARSLMKSGLRAAKSRTRRN